jgi:hypothetical protein
MSDLERILIIPVAVLFVGMLLLWDFVFGY